MNWKRKFILWLSLTNLAIFSVKFYFMKSDHVNILSDSRNALNNALNNGLLQEKEGKSLELKDFKDAMFHKKLQEIKDIKTKINTGNFTIPKKLPRFLIYGFNSEKAFWTQQLSDLTENRCPLPCTFTFDVKEKNSVDAIIFYLAHTEDVKTMYDTFYPRNLKQPWIMYSFENNIYARPMFHKDYSTFNGVFNRTMFHRRDSDVVIYHGFVVPKSDAEKYLPEAWHKPVNTNYSFDSNKTMAAAMISNCGDQSGRLKYINELKQYIKIDIYGKCGTLTCSTSNFIAKNYTVDTDECLRNIGSNYYFYLAFENSLCLDYLTEKIYNILYFPIIPVVLGGANYSELLPPHSYIDAGKTTPKKLADLMHHLISNPKTYFSYFEWKKYYTPSTIGNIRILCDLCDKLYDKDFYNYNVIKDFYDWFVTKSQCVDGYNAPPWLKYETKLL